jgi:hypothetical protein
MSRRSRLQLLGLLPHAAAMAPSLRPTLERGAWRFISGMAIDCDGAPMAYALPGSGKIGLDAIANAGTPGPPPHWPGLVRDNMGKPYVQGIGDPAPGYAVSQTALRDHTRHPSDPRAYVDAWEVPYVVMPPELRARGVDLGDLAAVLYGGKISFAIVADIGPHGHYGEASPACARLLDIPDSPRNGGASRGVTYVMFPGSKASPAWWRATIEFQAEASRLFAAWNHP